VQASPFRTCVLVIDEIAVDEYNKKLDDIFVSTVEPREHRIFDSKLSLEGGNMVNLDEYFGNTDMSVIAVDFW